MSPRYRLFVAAAVSATALAAGHAMAAECDGAGVITRIDGDPAAVNIIRASAKVTRPRVLEVICSGDRVSTLGPTHVTLSIDGKGVVRVDAGTPYLVAARSGAPSLAGNAYRAVNQVVMPDMKRLPWDVRLKGGNVDFAFALPQLTAGSQPLHRHRARAQRDRARPGFGRRRRPDLSDSGLRSGPVSCHRS